MTQLEVQLTADIRALKQQLNRAEKDLRNFGRQADKQGVVAQKGFTKAGKGAANATPSLLEFSRVVQDAPFGIQGVANNIQQLTANFGSLRQSAGSTTGALRLMFKGLKGPAGILLAVSAVTSLLVVFGDELKRSKQNAESLQKSLEKLNDRFGSELKLNKAISENLELQGKSTREINNARKEILKNQLEGLSLLVRQQQELLKTQMLENQTVSNWEAIVGYYKQAVTGAQSIFKLTTGIALAAAKNVDALKALLAPALLAADALKEGSNATAASKEDIEKQRELQSQLNNLLAQQKQIENEILKINQEQFKLKTFAPSVGPDPFKNFIQPDLLAGQARLAFENLSKVLAQDGPALIAPQLSNIEQRFRDFKDRLASSTLNLAGAVSGGFAQLGQSLAQGANLFQAVGASILSIMGDIATQLGQAAIAAGIAGLALKNLFANPVAAIAAGGALVAIGAALKSAQSSVSGIGGGGSVGGQGGSGSGFRGSSSSSFSSGGDGTVVFKIQGQDLVGVLQRTLGKNARLGGNLTIG